MQLSVCDIVIPIFMREEKLIEGKENNSIKTKENNLFNLFTSIYYYISFIPIQGVIYVGTGRLSEAKLVHWDFSKKILELTYSGPR